MQENLLMVKEERHFLLRKLYQQQGEVEPTTTVTKPQGNSLGSPLPNPEGITPKKNAKKRNSTEALGAWIHRQPRLPHSNVLTDSSQWFIENKSKPKRYCKATRKVVQLLPLDVHGRPVFPISLGDLTVYSLGEVITDRIAYHTEDFIYPVGYCSTRMFASSKDAHTKSLYTCKILDGGVNPR